MENDVLNRFAQDVTGGNARYTHLLDQVRSKRALTGARSAQQN